MKIRLNNGTHGQKKKKFRKFNQTGINLIPNNSTVDLPQFKIRRIEKKRIGLG